MQLEAADLVGGAVAVLDAAHQAQPRVPVALEGQDDVHQVFQQAGAGDGAVLGDMAHQEGGHAALLGGADERAGDLPDLGHAAGGAVDLGGGDGLHGVEDQQRRLHRVQVAQHGGQIGLGGQVQMVVQGADPVGAQPDLAGRLLARDVQGAVLLARRLGGHVQQQRGLADAGLAREQHHRAGHQSAAEHPVQLGHAGGAGGGLSAVDLADGHGGGGDPPASSYGPRARRTPRSSPTPGTRGSDRATWPSASRTRCSGRTDGPWWSSYGQPCTKP
ncbi:hypothetical protein SFUMM280S_05608 [Streptomyces fumanus]